MLITHTKRINSRPAHTHLVNTAEALRTLCGRTIDPTTWTYRKRRSDETPTCHYCRTALATRANHLANA